MTEPNDLQKAMAAAEQREPSVGGAGASFQLVKRPKFVGGQASAETHGPSISDIASERAAKIAERRAHAFAVVELAAAAGRHPRGSVSPAQATMAVTISEMLIAVMDERPIELPAIFRQASAPADLKRAQDVADALSGGEAA